MYHWRANARRRLCKRRLIWIYAFYACSNELFCLTRSIWSLRSSWMPVPNMFHKLEGSRPKDASYSIWALSPHSFWEKSFIGFTTYGHDYHHQACSQSLHKIEKSYTMNISCAFCMAMQEMKLIEQREWIGERDGLVGGGSGCIIQVYYDNGKTMFRNSIKNVYWDIFGRYFAISAKWDNVCEFLFELLHYNPLLKSVYSTRKECASFGDKFFPYTL